MQHPVGYVIRGGRAELENFWAVITQPFAILMFLHTVFAAYTLAGFFVVGVSAYHILRKQNLAFFTRSFRMAALFTMVFAVLQIVIGDLHGKDMARTQPTKLAAVESVWDTVKGAPFYMLVIPDEKNERNMVEVFGIPKFLSWLALDDWNAEFKGLKEWPPGERPPVALTFWSFRIMVGLGFLFAIVSVVTWLKRNRIEHSPVLLRVLVWMIPLPYIAAGLGWIVTEVGRQPWIVYGVMKTADAVSPIATYQVAISLAAFIVVYTLLGIACFYLIIKHARTGPQPLPQA
jgi:cytochrome d ubiquinol oxidase subunit I